MWPYIKAQKNDDRDAEGIAEAATRPTMRFVELKSQDQLDMQTLHRSRDRLVGERTALINQLRAILLERGMVAPQGKRKLEQFLAVLMDEQGGAGLIPRLDDRNRSSPCGRSANARPRRCAESSAMSRAQIEWV
jgi:transposase